MLVPLRSAPSNHSGAARQGRRRRIRSQFLRTLFLGTGLFALTLAQAAHAAPKGESVVRGTVAINRTSDLTTIRASNNSIISWQQFNIHARISNLGTS